MNRPPLDVRHPPLRAAVGGYDRSAVYAFLDRAAEDYDAARAALDELRAEHARVKAALEAARDHEREVARVLSAAEQAAGQTLERARQLASERISAAEGAAANLLREAEAERARVLADIDRTRDRTARVVRVLEAEIAGLQAPVADAAAHAVAPPPAATGGAAPGNDSRDRASEVPAAARPVGVPAPVVAQGIVSSDALPQLAPASAPIAVEVGKPSASIDDPQIPAPGIAAGTTIAGPGLPETLPAHMALAAVQGTMTPDVLDDRPRTDGEQREAPVARVDATAPASVEQSTADVVQMAAVPPRTPRRRMWVAAAAAAVVIVSVAAIPWLGASDAPVPEAHQPATSAPPKLAIPAQPAPRPATDLPQTARADPPTPTPAPDAITVHLEAKSACWVRLTIEGYSEERLLAAGEMLERTATNDVVLRTGNAGALVVTVNGRTIPPIGGEGEVVTRRITRPVSMN